MGGELPLRLLPFLAENSWGNSHFLEGGERTVSQMESHRISVECFNFCQVHCRLATDRTTRAERELFFFFFLIDFRLQVWLLVGGSSKKVLSTGDSACDLPADPRTQSLTYL